ncbi:MAG TPA: hypothetical protein VF767_03585 [Bryobacteraceae bacterium]
MRSCLVGLLAACAGLASAEPLLLDRLREKIANDLERLPAYRCRETVERTSVDGSVSHPLATLRFDVAQVGGKEVVSWPGEHRFSEKSIEMMASYLGAISFGEFALQLRNLFEPGVATFSAPVEEARDGRQTIRWDFKAPREKSRFQVGGPGGTAAVAYHGSVSVDPQTLDLMRLEIAVDDIPEGLGIASHRSVVEYSRVRIGTADFVLPAVANLEAQGSHVSLKSRLTYAACGPFGAPKSTPRPEMLPPGMMLDAEVDVPIELDKGAIGDPFSVALSRAVKKGPDIQLAKGTRLTGRITRLDKRSTFFGNVKTAYYTIGLELDGAKTAEGKEWEMCTTLEAARSIGNRYFVPFSQVLERGMTLWQQMENSVERPPACEGLLLSVADKSEIGRGVRLHFATAKPK